MRDFLIVLLSTTLISLSLTHNNRHYGDWVYYSLYAVYSTSSPVSLIARNSSKYTQHCPILWLGSLPLSAPIYTIQSTSWLRLHSLMSRILTHNNNIPPCRLVNLKCLTHIQRMMAALIMPRASRMQTQRLLNLLILMTSLRFLCLQILLTSPRAQMVAISKSRRVVGRSGSP